MKRRSIVLVLGCVLAIGSAAGTSGTVAATDECKPVSICESFPTAHVDSLCGTHTAKAQNQHVDSSIITDECTYTTGNGNSVVRLGRLCVTADFGGAGKAKLLFEAQRDDIQRNSRLTEMPGVGDQAYYRGISDNNNLGRLSVRKGNLLIEVSNSSVTAETEEALKTKCLVALYNELAAK